VPAAGVFSTARHALIDTIAASELAALDQWQTQRRERETLRAMAAGAIADERREARARLLRLVRHRSFRKALALASPVLSREYHQHLATPGREASMRAQRAERSLARYYARCAVKLSPFSSFSWTTLWHAETLTSDNGRSRASSGGQRRVPRPRVVRSVHINRSIVGNLARCVARHPTLGGYVPVARAASQLERAQELIVLQRQYDDGAATLMNLPREAVVVLATPRVLRFVTDCLDAHGGRAPFDAIVDALMPLLRARAEAAAWLRRLIDLGVLVHKLPLPTEAGDVLNVLACALARMPSPIASTIAEVVREWEEARVRFVTADDRERCRLLQHVDRGLVQAFTLLGAPCTHAWAALLYEDCVEGPMQPIALDSRWQARVDDLHQLLTLYGDLFDLNLSIRETIRETLRRDFQGGPVPVLAFLAHTCRQGWTAEGAPAYEPFFHTPNVAQIETLDQLARLREEMSEAFITPSSAPELDVGVMARERGWLARLHALNLESSYLPALCVACYGQPYLAEDGSPRFVLNQIGGGPARAVLRVGAALPDGPELARMLGEVRAGLEQIYAPEAPCEISVHHDFNANLHPRATRHIVDYADDIGDADNAWSVADLSLYVRADGQLAVRHAPSGRDLAPLTMGQMADSFAPPVQRLLFSLRHAWMVAAKPFHPTSWTWRPQERPVEQYPRLVLGGCVVRRRGWSLRREALPYRQPADSTLDYFMRVRRWREQWDLPEVVFVYASTHNEAIQDQRRGRWTWNNHKPQYIDFRNVWLVEVLGRLLLEVKERFYIEEMLPTREGWEALGLSRPTELVVDVILRRDVHTNRQTRASAERGAHVY
jgi:hypothetical protein